ncbi:3-hydroxyacyl-CoA dehydrogenase family protein [Rossellomorea sp. FM04394]|uniref:3-hydroxyacyl-CoA dehydrogenase family protein n=1 Tax=Rossellomorea sp. FM04394 TaxID=3243076 RepID=UPI0035A59DB5
MIAVIGSGTMGKGIAIEFARNNVEVVLVSISRNLEVSELRNEIKKVAERYNIKNVEEISARITTANTFDQLSNCDLIIEAMAEDSTYKREVMQEVCKHTESLSTIFATNTSSLSVSAVFEGIVPLNKVVGLHFFNPVQVMKLVEISYLEKTEDSVVSWVKELVTSINKEYVLVKNSPGFIVNRLLIPMINEAVKIVEEGIATPQDVDNAMKLGANFPVGPLKLSDLIGNDITLSILRELQSSSNTNIQISKTLEELVTERKLGRKTKKGFYSYN